MPRIYICRHGRPMYVGDPNSGLSPIGKEGLDKFEYTLRPFRFPPAEHGSQGVPTLFICTSVPRALESVMHIRQGARIIVDDEILTATSHSQRRSDALWKMCSLLSSQIRIGYKIVVIVTHQPDVQYFPLLIGRHYGVDGVNLDGAGLPYAHAFYIDTDKVSWGRVEF